MIPVPPGPFVMGDGDGDQGAIDNELGNAPRLGRNVLDTDGDRVVRGGSRGLDRRLARCAFRFRIVPDCFNSLMGCFGVVPGGFWILMFGFRPRLYSASETTSAAGKPL